MEITIDFGALDALKLAFSPRHKKALRRAMQAEGNRLRSVMRTEFAGGVGPFRAALTQELAKDQKSREKALVLLGRFVVYTVKEERGSFTLTVGPGQWRARKGGGALPASFLRELVEGGSHVVTKEQQRWIAYKLRSRWKEPVKNPRRAQTGERWLKKRARWGSGSRKWREIPAGWIPPVGTKLDWPERNWVDEVVTKERLRSPAYVHRLYQMSLRGERWGKSWWTDASFG